MPEAQLFQCFFYHTKCLLSETIAIGEARSIDLGALRLLIIVSTVRTLRLLKEERIPSANMCIPVFGTRLAKPYSDPCKADIYFCIFCRWIQCRPRTPLATLRNRVKSMYVLVSETYVMLQLCMLDPKRPEFVLDKKRSIPKKAGSLAD